MKFANDAMQSAKRLLEDFLSITRFLLLLPFIWTMPLSAQVANEEETEEESDEAVEEIIVTSTRGRRSFEASPTRVEILGSEELAEKGNMKPGDIRMLLNESTGIHVQQTSATSFNSSIRIQGLDGKYTQLLRDGMPLYSGFPSSLSLLQIAPLDLQQVEVIKGANSTLYGAGAIAGLVNLVSRSPAQEAEKNLLVNFTSSGGTDVSGFFSGRSATVGTTLYTAYNQSDAFDPADNGFSAIPEFERWTFNPGVYFYGDDSELRFAVNATAEERLGGAMNYIDGNRTLPAYFEDGTTLRLASLLDYSRQLDSGRELVLRNNFSRFRRELAVPGLEFSGVQLSSFSEAHVLGASSDLEWVAGLNLWTEDFEQDHALPGLAHDYSSHILGGFVQGTLPLSSNWTMETGLRFDHTSEHGDFLLPRISLLYDAGADTTVRIGGGLGYKLPTLFTDDAESLQFRGILPLQQDVLDAEQSAGMNLDINRDFALGDTLSLTLNLLLFYTKVDEPLLLVAQGPDSYAYEQPHGYLDTRGAELNAIWNWDSLRLFLGYTHADVREHRFGSVTDALLIPEDRLNAVLVYEREDDLRVGLEAYYYGPQRREDGSRSRDYWILGLMTEKMFGENFSVFLNFENFGDARQTRYESIYSGPIDNPRFNDLFAPLDGFVINGGFKLRF